MVMKSGKYYLGDPCYVLHNEWDEVCGKLFSHPDYDSLYSKVGMEFTLNNGVSFAMSGTYHGDGSYRNDFNNEYLDVDAGLIGVVPIDGIDTTNDRNDITLGTVIDIPQDFILMYHEGTISINLIGQNGYTFCNVFTGDDPDYDEDDGTDESFTWADSDPDH